VKAVSFTRSYRLKDGVNLSFPNAVFRFNAEIEKVRSRLKKKKEGIYHLF